MDTPLCCTKVYMLLLCFGSQKHKDVGQVAGSSLDRPAAGQDKDEVWQAGVGLDTGNSEHQVGPPKCMTLLKQLPSIAFCIRNQLVQSISLISYEYIRSTFCAYLVSILTF